MEKRLVDKFFTFAVDVGNSSYDKKFTLDKQVKVVHGLLLSSDKPQMLFYRGVQRIEISGDELFPEGYESKLLMSGISVPPNEKFRSLGNGVLAGNGEIKIRYEDVENVSASFEEYKVVIVLQCELS